MKLTALLSSVGHSDYFNMVANISLITEIVGILLLPIFVSNSKNERIPLRIISFNLKFKNQIDDLASK